MAMEAAAEGITAKDMTTENTVVIVTDREAAWLDSRLASRTGLL